MLRVMLPRTLEELLDIHAIERLKHRYLRCLDQKGWDELATCFTEGAQASYGGGAKELDGRDAILAFLVESMGSPGMLTSHRCTQPEIDLLILIDRDVFATEDQREIRETRVLETYVGGQKVWERDE